VRCGARGGDPVKFGFTLAPGETSVKQHPKIFLLATAIAVCLSGTSWAKDDDESCSKSTLSGLYVFHTSGFNIVSGAAQPKAILEIIRFNGDGTLTVPAATVSINGTVLQSPANGPGTYTIASSCMGSLAFGPPGPTFDLFTAFEGSRIYLIQNNSGTVFQGTAERVAH
jgi:hypothetical protein